MNDMTTAKMVLLVLTPFGHFGKINYNFCVLQLIPLQLKLAVVTQYIGTTFGMSASC